MKQIWMFVIGKLWFWRFQKFKLLRQRSCYISVCGATTGISYVRDKSSSNFVDKVLSFESLLYCENHSQAQRLTERLNNILLEINSIPKNYSSSVYRNNFQRTETKFCNAHYVAIWKSTFVQVLLILAISNTNMVHLQNSWGRSDSSAT